MTGGVWGRSPRWSRSWSATGDVVLARLAEEHETIEALTEWIRSLPQRDDLGDGDDGPRVDTCEPPQRLRLPAPDPNCVVMWSRPLCGALE